jgi:hypothetical protein
MLGPILIVFYRLVAVFAAVMPGDAGAAFKARCALKFSTLSDGGLDDDFANEAYLLIRKRPHLLEALPASSKNGFFAMRRNMTLDAIRAALAADQPDLFR